MRLFLSVIIFSIGSLLFAQQKQVCFSVDDMPVVSYGISDTLFQRDLISNLISSLKKNKIPAIGYVNEKKLYDGQAINTFQVDLLSEWLENGLELGNHSYSHPDYNTVSFKEFTANVLKGEAILKKLLSSKNMKLKYFRHPFLHLGNSKLKADSLSDFLSAHGYTTAPVTIDNDDYLFAVAYHRARLKKDTSLQLKIGHDYIFYLEKKLRYYEKQSNNLFNRNIKQILLMHASLLNSDYIDSLAIMFKKNGYEFISMNEALQDNAYQTKITTYGNWGISWIDRWALSIGKKKDFFKDEPTVPEYINVLSK